MSSDTELKSPSPGSWNGVEKEAVGNLSGSSGDDVAIRAENLSKCYHIYDKPQDRLKQSLVPRLQRLIGRPATQYAREFWALRDVSFEVKRGETWGIVGRNGSGKSTLLQLICGTLSPTAGRVETRGRVAALLELGSGFNRDFTGRENIYVNGAILGLTPAEIDRRFDDIAAFADIGHFIDQPVKMYSSGMYMRLAFAIIAHVDADILVIDEALAVGDAFFVQKCVRYLRRFQEYGTVLVVSHDTNAVVSLCKRALWLDKGAVNMAGTAKETSEAYMAALYEGRQGRLRNETAASSVRENMRSERVESVDQRLKYLNCSPYRNDLEIFRFTEDSSSFGRGGAKIEDVALLDRDGARLAWVVGGERVTLLVRVRALQRLAGPIVGFSLKDKRGQSLFGDNSFLAYRDQPISVGTGDTLEARFQFRMPILPVGDYSFAVAIAEGGQESHVQHQWMHDALILTSHSSSISTGLVGIPIERIDLTVNRDGR